jgi:hypothetical protein
MKLIAAICIFATFSRAGDLDHATWYTAASQEVYVACYWADQFPRFAESQKHLVIACPKAKWTAANPAKKNAILTAIRRFLNGDDPVSTAKIAAVRAALADANIGFALTDDPQEQLAAWGLAPPPDKTGVKP